MNSMSTEEALANLTSKSIELNKCLSSFDYKTRGFIIISEDDPHFTRRLKDWQEAIKCAEQVLLTIPRRLSRQREK